MHKIFTAILKFLMGPGDWIVFFVLVGAAYYLVKN